MNRRMQLATLVHPTLLKILGDDVGRPFVKLLDAVAYVLDDNDDLREENERWVTP